MPLAFAPKGEELKIMRVCGGAKRRLEDLGIVVGANIVLLSESGGNMIVRVNDSRLALDRSAASGIQVAM